MWYMWEGRAHPERRQRNPPLPFCLYGLAHITPHRLHSKSVAAYGHRRSCRFASHTRGAGTLR